LINKDYPTILVATLEDEVVGQVHIVPLGKGIWTIDSLAVDPSYIKRGVGGHLIEGSTEYIKMKRGKKAISSIRTDNAPALRIAEKLGFSPFQTTSSYFCEIDPQSTKIPENVVIEGFAPNDSEGVFEICRVVDPTKTKAYHVSPRDFLTSPLEWISNKMLHLRSEKVVLRVDDRIVGYAHVIYTTPHEAAKIKSFCFTPNPDLKRLEDALLAYVLNLLLKRNIRRVILNLNRERERMIETIKQRGFRHLASFYEISKNLN
jgi:GNAT superfamily N-acetyltransferase